MDPQTNKAIWINTRKVAKSNDKGLTWNFIGRIPERSGTSKLPSVFGNNLKYIGDSILACIGSDILCSTNYGHKGEFVHNVKDFISVMHVELI